MWSDLILLILDSKQKGLWDYCSEKNLILKQKVQVSQMSNISWKEVFSTDRNSI